MTISPQSLQTLLNGTEKQRVENLRSLLDYPLLLKDPEGGDFWYLKSGQNTEEAEETCPIAVGFRDFCDELADKELKQRLTEQEELIRGHYVNRIIPNQPVLYLLFPHTEQGRVVFILPAEGKLKQRSIKTYPWDSSELLNQLQRLQQGTLTLANKIKEGILGIIPQVDWIFYPPARTAKELAQALAVVTRRMEQAIPDVYAQESQEGYLHQLFDSFKKELLPNLLLRSENEKDYSFADIYAQTIAYGLFTARVFSFVKDPTRDFNREDAWEQLPETNPFLRQLFQSISERSPQELGEELLDAIAETFGILRAAKMDEILVDFRSKMNQEDIVIRFYEDFLAAYKPQMRERRGVYYTPEPVVSYMVRSVDELLKDKFNKPLGLADPEVMILDPACGTGTFLLWIFQLIHRRFEEDPEALTVGLEDRSWTGYVNERLLPRVFGFELLMAPYAICHLKLGLYLEETGYQFRSGKRLGVYLINTLEDIKLREEREQLSLDIPQMEELIAEEAKAGSRIKKNEPIMVVIGNPPYSGHSENNNEWIRGLVNDYYFVDGKPLGERNPKWLQDDYVKFIRFAQWRIDKSGQGILAFITNHGFLDNPTFRGMRQQILKTFGEIFIYDLHGNSKKQEVCLDGSKDENVFDIQQGVSINLMLKS
jgi:type I restriction-modification system DNA methylase subunit